jgi:hypothetical protein
MYFLDIFLSHNIGQGSMMRFWLVSSKEAAKEIRVFKRC